MSITPVLSDAVVGECHQSSCNDNISKVTRYLLIGDPHTAGRYPGSLRSLVSALLTREFVWSDMSQTISQYQIDQFEREDRLSFILVYHFSPRILLPPVLKVVRFAVTTPSPLDFHLGIIRELQSHGLGWNAGFHVGLIADIQVIFRLGVVGFIRRLWPRF